MKLDAGTKAFLNKMLNVMELICNETDEVFEEYAEGDYHPFKKTEFVRKQIKELEDELHYYG